MPATQVTISAVQGSWTQVCQYMNTRIALIVQLMDGDGVLAINTSAVPTQTTFGGTPAGIFTSAVDGTGPAQFQLQRDLDGDLAIQAWYIYVSNTGTPAPTPTVTVGQNAAVTTYNIVIPAGQSGIIVLWEAALFSAAQAGSVVTTTGGGTPTPIPAPFVDDGTTFASSTLWYWTATLAGETVTVTPDASGDCMFAWVVIPAKLPIDRSATATASGANYGLSTAPLLAASDWAVTAVVIFNGLTTGNVAQAQIDALGFNPATPFTLFNEAASEWILQMDVGRVAQIGLPLAMQWQQTFGSVAVGATLAGAAWPSASVPAAVVSVFEAFDIPESSPAGANFRTGLPKLSAGGVAALVGLQKRLGGQPEALNANTDTQGDV